MFRTSSTRQIATFTATVPWITRAASIVQAITMAGTEHPVLILVIILAWTMRRTIVTGCVWKAHALPRQCVAHAVSVAVVGTVQFLANAPAPARLAFAMAGSDLALTVPATLTDLHTTLLSSPPFFAVTHSVITKSVTAAVAEARLLRAIFSNVGRLAVTVWLLWVIEVARAVAGASVRARLV